MHGIPILGELMVVLAVSLLGFLFEEYVNPRLRDEEEVALR